ncbi:MAG: hypothetical protein K6G65_09835 [Lachnospiraceae bacterium]|nr:hypothetical protein [Lachnospiraceae bacterium]
MSEDTFDMEYQDNTVDESDEYQNSAIAGKMIMLTEKDSSYSQKIAQYLQSLGAAVIYKGAHLSENPEYIICTDLMRAGEDVEYFEQSSFTASRDLLEDMRENFELSKMCNAEMLVISSSKVYGAVHENKEALTEDMLGYVDQNLYLNAYAQTVREVEMLCASLVRNDNAKINIARVFGSDRLDEVVGKTDIGKNANRNFAGEIDFVLDSFLTLLCAEEKGQVVNVASLPENADEIKRESLFDKIPDVPAKNGEYVC